MVVMAMSALHVLYGPNELYKYSSPPLVLATSARDRRHMSGMLQEMR